MRKLHSRRGLRQAASVLAVSVVTMVVGASPAAAATGTVRTAGDPLTVRRAPSTSSTAVGTIANGATATIDCQTTGTSVSGTFGTSTTWDYVPAKGGYVSDTYVYTGSDDRIAPDCGVGTGSAQCSTGICAGEAQFKSSTKRMVVYDRNADGKSAVVLYWTKGGAGPFYVWASGGSGTNVDQAVSVASGSWIFYKVCIADHVAVPAPANCSAGLTDYAA